jgi:N4-gp56 family major capsid protein
MLNYNAPADGAKSSIDGSGSDQMQTFFYLKKAIIQSRKEQYFMPLASVTNMPKNFGKTIKVYEYVPLLDDRNINDQGIDANGVTIANGNLYGSSRDVGTITSKLPALTENGGRVNRVGFTRLSRQGSLHKFGFFMEFTQESMDFDTDAELMDNLSRELMNGAVQLTEAVLQKDLLSAAGVIVYAGAATNNGTITGEVIGGAPATIVSYANLMRLDQILNDNRTPKQTTVITGSRLIDTKTIPAGRVMFIGTELVPLIKGMVDLFGHQAFIPVQQYGDAGTILNGEIGVIDTFRIVLVPEMLHWAGVGAVVGTNPGYRTTTIAGQNRYDVYPMLVVGEGSFTTIGFQTDGKSVKFSVMTKMPGKETADRNDPYGETGFSSIKWYYGFMTMRPERIALLKTVAPV